MIHIIAMIVTIIGGALGDIFFGEGMKALGQILLWHLNDIPALLGRVFSNRCILLGVVSHAIYFAALITALAWVDVSVVIPLTALSYVLTAIYAAFISHEHVVPQRWIGVVIIATGAALVGASS